MYMPFDAREHMQTPMHVQVHGIARACTGGNMCEHLRVRDAFLEAPLQPEAGLPGAGTFTPDIGGARACLIVCVRAPAVRHGGAQRTHNTPRMHAQAWIRGGRRASAARAPNAPIRATRAPCKYPGGRKDLAGAPPPPRPVRARRSKGKSKTHLNCPAAMPGSARPAQAEGAAHLRKSPRKRHDRPHGHVFSQGI